MLAAGSVLIGLCIGTRMQEFPSGVHLHSFSPTPTHCLHVLLHLLIVCFQDDVELWGQEYLRNIAGEIGEEYQVRRDGEEAAEDLLALVRQIVPYHMTHNSGVLSQYKEHKIGGMLREHVRWTH